jgi:uncharacterized membrane protein
MEKILKTLLESWAIGITVVAGLALFVVTFMCMISPYELSGWRLVLRVCGWIALVTIIGYMILKGQPTWMN